MKLNKWLLDKVLSYLTSREGVEASTISYSDPAKAEVVDAFGHRYEIQVRLISRNIVGRDDVNSEFIPYIT